MAGNSLEAFGGTTISSVRRLTTTQQVMLAGVFVAVVAAIFAVSRFGGSTSMGILYSGLEPEAAASVVDELESRGIPYELSDSGRVVWVPRQQVASTRLDMSAQGLPDASEGWSVLDDQGITSSEFDQRVGYQRAMEGELASTIAVIDGVSSANVHLVIPEQDLFVGDEIKASASVLLQTGGSTITPMQVQSIVNLVASSVEGLVAAEVTVTDETGRLLAGGDEGGIAGMETDSHIRMKQAFEQDVAQEVRELLVAVVGPGRSRVTVNADLDFDTVMRTEETYNEPTNAAGLTLPKSETTRLEEYGSSAEDEEGVVTIEEEILEGPPENAAGGTSNYRLDERDVVYALDSVVTSTEKAPGTIRSMSVAVVIDEEVLPAERVPEIEGMVAAAVGADPERGDIVSINMLPFELSAADQEAAELAAAEASATGSSPIPLIRTAGTVLIGLLVLLLGLRSIRKASRRKVIDSIDLEALPSGEGGAAAIDPATGELLELEAAQAPEVTEDDLLELVANQPDDIAAVLRQWLTEPESV